MIFSVLIAHYNNFLYFKKCYESLTQQTFKDFEIIIVDDCSTDNSLNEIIALTKGDERVKIYSNPENMGVGFTKKKCVTLANGEICGFLDPDDALTPDAIEISTNAYKNNKIIATYSQFYICDENLNIQKIFPNSARIKNKNPLFFNVNLEVAHFFTFKKDAYLKTEGINENYKVVEDIDFYLKLYEIGEFKFIKKPLLLYRVHNVGLSHDERKKNVKSQTWHIVIFNASKRRNINSLYGKNINDIENLTKFLHQKQNTLYHKVLKKIMNLLP